MPALLTAKEAAELLRVTEVRVYALAREGLVPSVRLGRQVRFSRQALEAFIDGGGQALPGGWKRDPESRGAA